MAAAHNATPKLDFFERVDGGGYSILLSTTGEEMGEYVCRMPSQDAILENNSKQKDVIRKQKILISNLMEQIDSMEKDLDYGHKVTSILIKKIKEFGGEDVNISKMEMDDNDEE